MSQESVPNPQTSDVDATAQVNLIPTPPAQPPTPFEALEEEKARQVIASKNIASGLTFLGHMAALDQQLRQVEQLTARLAELQPAADRESWFGKAIGKAFNPVTGSKNLYEDVAHQAELALWTEFYHCCYVLRQIVKTSKDWQRVLCVMASKGGVSKTPLIFYLAAIFAFVTSTTNLFLEANENDGTGNNRSGQPRESQALLNDVIDDHNLVADVPTATMMLGKFEQACLWVLLSAANATENDFNMPEFLSMFDAIRPKYNNVWGDTGNGNRRASNEGMFLESDVAFFPALADNSDSWSTVITTMINLYQAGHAKKLQERSFVVISATNEDHTVEQFLRIFRDYAAAAVKPRYDYKSGKDNVAPLWTTDPDQLLRDLGFKYDEATNELSGEGVFMVRHSSWIAEGNIASVRPEDVGLGTVVDYLKILVAAFTVPTQNKAEKNAEIERRIRERGDVITAYVAENARISSLLANVERAMKSSDPSTLTTAVTELFTYQEARLEPSPEAEQ